MEIVLGYLYTFVGKVDDQPESRDDRGQEYEKYLHDCSVMVGLLISSSLSYSLLKCPMRSLIIPLLVTIGSPMRDSQTILPGISADFHFLCVQQYLLFRIPPDCQ